MVNIHHEKKQTIKTDKLTYYNSKSNKSHKTSGNSAKAKSTDGEHCHEEKSVIDAYNDAKQSLKDHGISISTITLDCKLHSLIDVNRFAKYVKLKENGIASVKFGNRNDPATNRKLPGLVIKKKPSKRNFYNQVTILMKPTNNPIRNHINIKVFKNGSLQMTGCKDMDDFNNVTSTLIKILKRGRNVKRKTGVREHVDFLESPKEIGIFDVSIRMINSGFRYGHKIDRKLFYKILTTNHGKKSRDREIGYVECKYEPTGGHSCVNIKYNYGEGNSPSIFVFQTGAIIITGARNLQQILMAHGFITKLLDRYINKIQIINLDSKLVQLEIERYFKNKITSTTSENASRTSKNTSRTNKNASTTSKNTSRTNGKKLQQQNL